MTTFAPPRPAPAPLPRRAPRLPPATNAPVPQIFTAADSLPARVFGIATEVTASSSSKEAIADRLAEARRRTYELIEPLDDEQLNRVYSPILSPLAWDLGHIANFEELWLVQTIGEREPLHGELGRFYDAIENPRKTRGELPILRDAELRSYLADVRERTLEVLDEVDIAADAERSAAARRLRLRDVARPRAAAQRDDAAAAADGRRVRAPGAVRASGSRGISRPDKRRANWPDALSIRPFERCPVAAEYEIGAPDRRIRLRQRAAAAHRRARRLRDRSNSRHQRRVHRLHGGDRGGAASLLGGRRRGPAG